MESIWLKTFDQSLFAATFLLLATVMLSLVGLSIFDLSVVSASGFAVLFLFAFSNVFIPINWK